MSQLRQLTVLVDEMNPGGFTWTVIEKFNSVGQWQNVDIGSHGYTSWVGAWNAGVAALHMQIGDLELGPRMHLPQTPNEAVAFVTKAFPYLEVRKHTTQTSFWVPGMQSNRGRVLRIGEDGSVKLAASALRGGPTRDVKLNLLTDGLVTIVRRELCVLANEAEGAALESIHQMLRGLTGPATDSPLKL